MNGQRKHILIRQNITEQWEEMKSIWSLLIWPSCKEAGHKRPHIWFHSEISRAFRHANAGGGAALKWPRVRRCQTVETDHTAAVQGRSLTTVPWAARNKKKSASRGKETFPCPFRSQRPLLYLGSSSPSSKPAGPRLTPGHLISFHITWLTYLDTSHDWYILTHHITDWVFPLLLLLFQESLFSHWPTWTIHTSLPTWRSTEWQAQFHLLLSLTFTS